MGIRYTSYNNNLNRHLNRLSTCRIEIGQNSGMVHDQEIRISRIVFLARLCVNRAANGFSVSEII